MTLDYTNYSTSYPPYLYGLAYLLMLPVAVFVLVDRFQVSYQEFGTIRLVLVQLGLMAAYPLAGRLMDRGGPYRTAGWAFGTLAAYPLLLGLAVQTGGSVLLWVAFLAFGASMALVDVAWYLSSAHFARHLDSAPFMGVHVLLVGVRSLFAPFLGLALYRWAGCHGALAVAAGLFLLSSWLMWTSPDRRNEEGDPSERPAELDPDSPVEVIRGSEGGPLVASTDRPGGVQGL